MESLNIKKKTMKSRQKQLSDLKCYLQTVDTEVTIILQSLQWNRKGLLEGTSKVTCQYDANHKVPKESLQAHEDNCQLRKLGYSEKDEILPDPLNENAVSFVKLSMTDIQHIINTAAETDPLFKRVSSTQGPGCMEPKPLTLERLQAAYTADERRAIYDAVVRAAPSCSDLSELALPSTNEENQNGASKSRLEILAELRDMKRRRTKYRVAAKTQKYSDVLRDVIRTQMEVYSEVKAEEASTTARVSSKKLSYTKDGCGPKRDPKEIKLEDSYTREKHKKYRTDSSRERCEETRSNSEIRKRDDYEDKYRDNKQRERRYKTEKDRYYDADRDRRKFRHEKAHEKKYERGQSRHGQTSSSRDGSRDEWSHSNRGNNTKYVKEEHGGYNYRPEKDEYKHKRYYDVRVKEEYK